MINLRSPYFVYETATNLTRVDMELYVYTGTQTTDRPGSPQYTLNVTAYNIKVAIDIAQLAADYIDSTFDGTYSSTAIWIDYRTKNYISGVPGSYGSYTQLLGLDGYHYYEDGAFGNTSTYTAPTLLQSNTKIYKNDDGVIRVPILQDYTPTITFLHRGQSVREVAITPTSESTDAIRYVSNSGASQDDFKARVEADSGTYEPEGLGSVFVKYGTQKCDAVIVEDSSDIIRLEVENIPEQRYTPRKVTFVNKFGALQDVWFFKLSSSAITTESQTYKANIITAEGSYTVGHHQKRSLNKNGIERMQLNSGYYPESYNEVFRQLMLSERVWINIDGDTLPIVITNSDFEFKKHVNDKLINHSIEVEFAFNKINSIR